MRDPDRPRVPRARVLPVSHEPPSSVGTPGYVLPDFFLLPSPCHAPRHCGAKRSSNSEKQHHPKHGDRQPLVLTTNQ